MQINNRRVNIGIDGRCYPIPVDIQGRPVQKTKYHWPYSYDQFVVWQNDYNVTDSAVYSDRLMDWNYKLFNECCQKVFGNTGQYFFNREPKDIEKFLSLYMGKQIKLTGIEEGCNVASGYPLWIFYYREK